jgi:hypothetical protein
VTKSTNGKRTGLSKGWLVAGLSVALLAGIALLKGRADRPGSDLDTQ